jgi:septum formation protein
VRRLVLASASPARLATLRDAGIDPTVIVSGVDESVVDEADPAVHVARLAELKAQAVVGRLAGEPAQADWVLGCDSMLAFDGRTLGKPGDAATAVRLWQAMRGRSGVLHTGHCLVDVAGRRQLQRSVATVVHFAELSDEEIEAYVGTGEPLQVAGGFTIDGRGGAFVSGIEGDHHNVVGLSIPVLRLMVAELGARWTDLWTTPPTALG